MLCAIQSLSIVVQLQACQSHEHYFITVPKKLITLFKQLNARFRERSRRRPVPDLSWIAADAHPRRYRRGRPGENENLEPTRRTDFIIRRRGNRTRVARTGESGEDGALTHAIAMGARHGAEERRAHAGRAAGRDGDGDHLAIGPIFVGDGEGWSRREAGENVWWLEDFDSVFFGVLAVLRVGAGDEDSAVLECDGFGMV